MRNGLHIAASSQLKRGTTTARGANTASFGGLPRIYIHWVRLRIINRGERCAVIGGSASAHRGSTSKASSEGQAQDDECKE